MAVETISALRSTSTLPSTSAEAEGMIDAGKADDAAIRVTASSSEG
jgi:hypothetical protein